MEMWFLENFLENGFLVSQAEEKVYFLLAECDLQDSCRQGAEKFFENFVDFPPHDA